MGTVDLSVRSMSDARALNAIAGAVQGATDGFVPFSARYAIARDALAALLALPVDQRMAAMGMKLIGKWDGDGMYAAANADIDEIDPATGDVKDDLPTGHIAGTGAYDAPCSDPSCEVCS